MWEAKNLIGSQNALLSWQFKTCLVKSTAALEFTVILHYHQVCYFFTGIAECIVALPELNLSRMKLDIIQAFPRMELVLTLKKKKYMWCT